MELEQQRQAHTMTLEGRARARVTGVMAVSCFNEQEVVLQTSEGEVALLGEGLHIERIDLDSGQLEVRGKVQELSYDESAPKGTLWSRLFGG